MEIDGPARDVIARAAGVIRASLDRMPGSGLRWVPLDNLHLTIRFLGELAPDRAGRVRAALSPPLSIVPFTVAFGGAGVFPPRGAPRVLLMGVREGGPALARLFELVEARMRVAGEPADLRSFSPHLTLARFRGRGRAPRGEPVSNALDDAPAELAVQPVAAVTLFRSRLSPSGSRYEPLLRVPLVAPS
jgi:2'-5' RNA ligase